MAVGGQMCVEEVAQTVIAGLWPSGKGPAVVAETQPLKIVMRFDGDRA